jgi:hypothetical protein
VPEVPPANLEYAEQVLSRGFALQFDVASFLATGALTVLTVILAVYSLLLTLAAERADLPTIGWLLGSAVLVLAAGGLLLGSWGSCDLEPESDPTTVAAELIVKRRPVEQVRNELVQRMTANYLANRQRLAYSQLLLAAAIPIAAVGVGLLLYGGAV